MPVQTQLQMRRDTAANWTSTNPTLASGEWGLETDTRLMKIGDGATAWNSLGYQLNSLLDEDLATDPNGAYFDGTGLVINSAAPISGNYAEAPNIAAYQITGDITVIAYVQSVDWTSTIQTMINRIGSGDVTNGAYGFGINASGGLSFSFSTGTGVVNVTNSTSAVPFSDNSGGWVAFTFDVDNGSSQTVAKFWTSTDSSSTALASINWTQLGNTITSSGTTSINAGTRQMRIGARMNQGDQLFNGIIYRAVVCSGFGTNQAPATTPVFDANFTAVPADSFAFTESSANAATVTLTTTRYSFGVPSSTLINTGGSVSLSGNTTVYIPFTVRNKPITIKHFAFETITAPAANTNLRLGVYAINSLLQPTGNIIYSSDAITVSSAAAAIYRIRVTPFTLMPGNYAIAVNGGPQTIPFRPVLNGAFMFAPNTLGANITRQYQVSSSLAGAALPTTGPNWTFRNNGNGAFFTYIILGW